MKHYFILSLFIGVFLGCNNPPKNGKDIPKAKTVDTVDNSLESLEKKENDTKFNLSIPGEFHSEIYYQLVARKEDADIFEDGIEPWISLENPQKDLARLQKPNEIVLSCDSATLIIDYPIKDHAIFVIKKNMKSFSRKDLALEISKIYHQMYVDEENTATIKTLPMKDRKIMNRNETNGKYGIWGHDLSDLVLTSIKVYKNGKGQIYLTLEIDS